MSAGLHAEPEPRDWRRAALILIALGLMSVSIGGQFQTLQDRLGDFLAAVFAVGHDLAALLALDTAMRADEGSSIRKWAWACILLAAITGGTINAYHIIVQPGSDGKLPPLPLEMGLLIGLEPIVLILALSHLISLAVAAARQRFVGDGRTVGGAVADLQRATTSPDHQPDHQRTTSTTSADHQRRHQPTTSPTTSAPPATGQQTTSRPPALPAGDLQGPLVMTTSDADSAALVITTGAPSSPTGSTAGRLAAPKPAAKPAAKPAPSSAADSPGKPARPTARQEWMTDLLVHKVARKLATAAAAGETYGRPQLMAEHGLTDWRARALLNYIAERDLAREVAS